MGRLGRDREEEWHCNPNLAPTPATTRVQHTVKNFHICEGQTRNLSIQHTMSFFNQQSTSTGACILEKSALTALFPLTKTADKEKVTENVITLYEFIHLSWEYHWGNDLI